MMRQFLAILVGSGLVLMGSAAFAGQENSGDRIFAPEQQAPYTQQAASPTAKSVTVPDTSATYRIAPEPDHNLR